MGMKAPTEASVLAACMLLLKLRGVFAWRSNNVGVYDPVRKCHRSFRGLKGVADILGVVDGGRILACEVKGPRGRLTEEQDHFLAQVRVKGGVALCVHDVKELEAELARLGY
jgi:hypothetical protein